MRVAYRAEPNALQLLLATIAAVVALIERMDWTSDTPEIAYINYS